MTTNIFSVLNVAKSSLLSQQLAIEVTGQNIANVQTKGYTRQEVNLETTTPRTISLGQLGTGVRVRSITRDFDKFLFNQILGEGSTTGNFDIRKDVYDKLEILFNESAGRSLNGEMTDFFSSFNDLSINPAGLPERSTAINTAESLILTMNRMGEALFQERLNLDLVVEDEVRGINSLLDEILELNLAIHAGEPRDTPANDLRDQRDRAVKELSEKMDIRVIDNGTSQVELTLADGTPLLLSIRNFKLSTQTNGDNRGFKDILIDDGGSGTVNITSRIQGGKMRGLLDMRDREVLEAIDRLDRLAAGFIQEVNRVHQLGLGTDGSTGLDFFEENSPTVHLNTQNTGTAVVAMTNASPSTVSVDQFQIQFTGASTFDLINKTTGALDGSFSFTVGTTFNLAGGLAVTINGAAAAGDIVDFSVSEDAAVSMRMNQVVATDPRKIAAGTITSEDGGNALDLADLQNRLIYDGETFSPGSGTATFDEFYNALVSTVGVNASSSQAVVAQQEGIMLQLNNRRESISGVSIDEEMINLIKFQQAYQAAARMINTVNEMFDILQTQI